MSELYGQSGLATRKAASWAPLILQDISREAVVKVVKDRYGPGTPRTYIDETTDLIMKGLPNLVVWPKAVW